MISRFNLLSFMCDLGLLDCQLGVEMG